MNVTILFLQGEEAKLIHHPSPIHHSTITTKHLIPDFISLQWRHYQSVYLTLYYIVVKWPLSLSASPSQYCVQYLDHLEPRDAICTPSNARLFVLTSRVSKATTTTTTVAIRLLY